MQNVQVVRLLLIRWALRLGVALPKRILASSVLALVWSTIGPDALDGVSGPYGLTAAATALVILVIAVCGCGLVRNWRLRTVATLCTIATVSFIGGYLVYTAWVASRGFPAALLSVPF